MNTQIKQVLKHHFGFEEFREFQEEAINTLLKRKDLFMILPTGGGKSLCYQLPALLLRGMAVVISPLIALMQDQVRSLQDRGISAAFLASSNTKEEQEAIYEQLYHDKIKMLYVAPERLGSERFLSLCKALKEESK